MKTAITNRTEADKIIDQFGANLKKIKDLQDTNKKLKSTYEAWANAHPDLAFDGERMEGRTDTFAYAMAVGDPVLKIQSHLADEDVIARMKADEKMSEYVIETYDREGIKGDFGGSASKRRSVEDFGLFFTTPKPHLVVEAL